MGIFFNFLTNFLEDKMVYTESFKFFYLIGTVIVGLAFYILVALFIKAFKVSDIKLEY